MRKVVASLAVAVLGSVMAIIPAVAPAQEKKKQVKDQAEYDVFMAAQNAAKANDWAKAVQLLQQWKEKYPDSDYKEERQTTLITAYQNLRQGDKMWDASKDLLALNPKSVAALFYLTTLTVSLNNTAPDRLDTGEKAARGLMENLGEFKEANVKQQMETTARKTLGWIAMQKKDYAKAEQEFADLLKFNPNAGGQISYWLGTVMLQQKKAEKQIPALWQFARAGHVSEGESLTPEGKKQLQAFLERNYANFHGSKDGLPELIAAATKEPFPPADFKIKSSQEIAVEQEEELKKSDPQKALWLGVKKELAGPNGQAYFDSTLKGSALPKLRGKVVEGKPVARPKEVVVALSTDTNAEVTLKLDAPMAGKADPGTEIQFEGGVAEAFTPDPFMLTLTQEKAKVEGWPAAPKAAPKAGAGKKGVAGKK